MSTPTDLGRIVKASDTVTYQKVGRTMFEILWDRMDELLAEFTLKKAVHEPPAHAPWAESRELHELRGEMRGVAFAIKEWSGNWYQEPNAIAKHAMVRYQAKANGEEMPQTVGCNGYNPLPVERTPKGFKDISKPKVMAISPETEKQIRAGLAAGFSIQDLMSIYKVDQATVESFK